MAPSSAQSQLAAFWMLVRRQHWVVARRQLLDLGFGSEWVRHRVDRGRLLPVHRGVYAVGRPSLTQAGRWMAAVLACGPGAVLSHRSAGALWGLLRARGGPIDVSLPTGSFNRPPGIRTHRRPSLTGAELAAHRNVPVTTPARTLIDLATTLAPPELEAAVNEADALDRIDPERLRDEVSARPGQPGTRALRELLDRDSFRLTESELERRFLRLVRRAGLALPETQVRLGGRVDFHWPDAGLVVETDGWRYHRTPARQARDNRRMQAHAAAGRTAVRFSHREIRFESARVIETLAALARRSG